MNKTKFVKDTLFKCIDNNIKFELLDEKSKNNCSGWFDGDGEELVVCAGNDSWIETLLHESCHLDQWLENPSAFTHPWSTLDCWTDWKLAKKHPKKYLWAFRHICASEIDCDLRVLKKIQEYNLNVDIGEYIRGANCYHASYYYFHKYRCFYDISHIPSNDIDLFYSFTDKKIQPLHKAWSEHKELGKFIKKYNTKL